MAQAMVRVDSSFGASGTVRSHGSITGALQASDIDKIPTSR